MKKLISMCAFLLMFAGCAGLMGGGNPKIKDLENRAASIAGKFIYALNYSVQAFENAYSAVGNKEEAERIKSEAGGLKVGDDQDKLEASIGTLNEVDIGAALENAGELSAEGKKQISVAILNLGIAIVFDGFVIADVPAVVTDSKDILQNLSASDAMSAGSVKNIVANATFIAEVAPDQLALLKKNFETLKAYADAHGIPVPSQEEIEQAASGIEME